MDYLIFGLLFLFIVTVIKKPFWGGLIIVATLPSFLLRTSIAGIPTTLLELMIYAWFLVGYIAIIKHGQWHDFVIKVLKNKIVWVYGLFVLVAGLQVLVGDDIRLGFGAWKGWMLDPFIFLITSVYFDSSMKKLHSLVYATFGTVLLVSVWGLVEYFGDFGMQIPGFVNAMFTSANYVSLLLVPLILLLLGLTLEQIRKNKINNNRLVVLIILYLFVFVTIVLTRSYAGMLSLGISGMMMIFYLPKTFKFKKQIIITAMIMSVFVFASIATQGKLQSYFDNTDYNSFQTRQQIWNVTWELIYKNPVFGVGFGNFEPAYYDKAFEIYHPPLEWEVPRAHNLFLHTWVEVGLIGFGIFLYLLFILFKKVVIEYRKNGNIFYLGVLASLVSIVVYGFFDTPYYKNDLSIVFVILLVLVSYLYQTSDELRLG